GGDADEMATERARLARKAVEVRGAVPTDDSPTSLGTIVHTFSHLKVTYDLYLFQGARLDRRLEAEADGDRREVRIVALDELDGLPLPVAQQKIGERVRTALREGGER
ncbi:MAG: hypothetical protein R3223_09325, partial [Longimicrobiales bacterium]|nr:hypothetical protein [Longimicrobiales bacterium]